MMEFHEYANFFPMMSAGEYAALLDDMRSHGYDTRQPIAIYDGKILDGRNRYKASCELGIDPVYRDYDGDDPLQFVIRYNLNRRHLNESQRAVIAARLANMTRGGDRPSTQDLNFDSANLHIRNDISQEQAARMLNVSSRMVASVKAIEREAPERLQEIESGEKNVNKVIQELQREKRHNNKIDIQFPEGKYQVIYADPPWQYDNSGFEQSAESYYPTLNTEKIKELDIASLAGEPCVLFLWATSPLLPEAIDVMESWGFEYKASRVWIKNKAPGIGWWMKTRHELLLIGTKNGNAHPLEKIDSVIYGDNTNHSEKPKSVYEDIELCYMGKKIELFARNSRPGWDSWGNENVK